MQGVSKTVRRRRQEGKTDYKARMPLLKSGKPRVVFRKSNRYLFGQIVISEIAQDKVIAGASTKELLSNGWPKNLSGSLKSLPAAYLMGYMLAKRVKGVNEGILDIGLLRHVAKSRAYAFVRGMKDGGFEILCSDDVLPDDKMLSKKPETAKLINQLKEKLG